MVASPGGARIPGSCLSLFSVGLCPTYASQRMRVHADSKEGSIADCASGTGGGFFTPSARARSPGSLTRHDASRASSMDMSTPTPTRPSTLAVSIVAALRSIAPDIMERARARAIARERNAAAQIAR